jgi:Mg2+/Co2+ transporter CorB
MRSPILLRPRASRDFIARNPQLQRGKLRRTQDLNRRKKLIRTGAWLATNSAVAALLIVTGDRVVVAAGVALAAFAATFLVLMVAARIQNEYWDRHWPERLAAARAKAERVLEQLPHQA